MCTEPCASCWTFLNLSAVDVCCVRMVQEILKLTIVNGYIVLQKIEWGEKMAESIGRVPCRASLNFLLFGISVGRIQKGGKHTLLEIEA